MQSSHSYSNSSPLKQLAKYHIFLLYTVHNYSHKHMYISYILLKMVFYMHMHIKFLQNIVFLFTYVLSFQIHFLKLYYYLYWINENEVNYPAHFVCHKIS